MALEVLLERLDRFDRGRSTARDDDPQRRLSKDARSSTLSIATIDAGAVAI
jgi:hypothetical protein